MHEATKLILVTNNDLGNPQVASIRTISSSWLWIAVKLLIHRKKRIYFITCFLDAVSNKYPRECAARDSIASTRC